MPKMLFRLTEYYSGVISLQRFLLSEDFYLQKAKNICLYVQLLRARHQKKVPAHTALLLEKSKR